VSSAAAGSPAESAARPPGLAQNNPLLVQIMADVLRGVVEVPQIDNATAVGEAIHGAIAAERIPDFATGAAKYGACLHRVRAAPPSVAAPFKKTA
jgi:L-ribulokinase